MGIMRNTAVECPSYDEEYWKKRNALQAYLKQAYSQLQVIIDHMDAFIDSPMLTVDIAYIKQKLDQAVSVKTNEGFELKNKDNNVSATSS
jgi:hypothetical protein